MNNYQNPTNFFIRIYGNTVKQITGKDEFECAVTGIPTPELAVSFASYPTHPNVKLASKTTKGRVPGNTLMNDDILDMEVLIDENMESYLFMVKWLASVTVGERLHPANVDDTNFIEAVITDNQKNTLLVFKYNKVSITRVAQVQLSAQLSDPGEMVVPVSIMYDSVNITDKDGVVIF